MKTFKTPLLYLLQIAAALVIFSSCKKAPEVIPVQKTLIGDVYVVCEGSFGSGNGTITFLNNGIVDNDIFQNANHRPLGDQAQSMTLYGGKAYVLVQNSGKIEVVDTATFVSSAIIDDKISSPRNVVVYNNTGYVSDWTSNKIKVINLSTNLVTDSITVDEVPDGLLVKGTTLYVSNTGLNWGVGTHISIIDLTTNTKTGSIITSGNPADMVEDANGKIWVLCGGDGFSGVNGALVKIDPSTNTVLTTVNFSTPGDFPYHLKKNIASNVLYYTIGGQLFKFPITATTESTTPFITRNFYSFGISPANDEVIGTIAAADFVS